MSGVDNEREGEGGGRGELNSLLLLTHSALQCSFRPKFWEIEIRRRKRRYINTENKEKICLYGEEREEI